MTTPRPLAWAGATALLAALLIGGGYATGAGPAVLGADEVNPCAAKTINPCAAKTLNPCTAKAAGNPCSAKPAAANPCGGNPCGGASVDPAKIRQGSRKLSSRADVALGEKLWNDRMLGKSGLACASCHIGNYAQMQPGFQKPYPHRVAMPARQAGLSQVNAAEMVQFCMVVPMMAEPLGWDSPELASLTAYVESIQDGYRPVGGAAANPCNPCAMKNPCSPRSR